MTIAEISDENFEDLLEEFATPADIEAVKKEKEAGLFSKAKGKRELLKKYPEPQIELDLHHHTGEEAKRMIGMFIERAQYHKVRTLRIITGKGVHSEEGKSVLRDVTEEEIFGLKKKGFVLDFKWESGKKDRSGALIVYLT